MPSLEANNNQIITRNPVTAENTTLREQVLGALDRYFAHFDHHDPKHVHRFVLEEVESALYESVMRFTRGNQSRAARILGVSRGTLRTKLEKYFATTHVGVLR